MSLIELTEWERLRIAMWAAATSLTYAGHEARGALFPHEVEEGKRWRTLSKKMADIEAGTATPAIRDVVAERHRQIEKEGWSPEHDDEHVNGELALAAALYALPYDHPSIRQDHYICLDMVLSLHDEWELKPESDKRRRLVKAGALILAEIERLDRAQQPGDKTND